MTELTAKEYFTQKGKDMVQKRNERLTPEERSAIASKAGKTRWAKYTKKEKLAQMKRIWDNRDKKKALKNKDICDKTS